MPPPMTLVNLQGHLFLFANKRSLLFWFLTESPFKRHQQGRINHSAIYAMA